MTVLTQDVKQTSVKFFPAEKTNEENHWQHSFRRFYTLVPGVPLNCFELKQSFSSAIRQNAVVLS